MQDSRGRVVVTGSSSGVGLATARHLMAQSWSVIGLDRDQGPDGFETVACDLADAARIEAAFARIGGPLQALVCSAGILRLASLAGMAVADFDALFAINTRGAWLCARSALPSLTAAATAERPAHIVFVTSVAIARPKPTTGAYSATKAALAQIARVLAGELAPQHVLVNAVAPGSMDTPMTRNLAGPEGYRRSALPPSGRATTPADVASAIALLLAPDQRSITGATIPVDGGAAAIYQPPEAP